MIFEYYLVFAITTALCMVSLNRSAKLECGIQESTLVFYTISFITGFLFAPVFFLIFIFYSKGYKEGIIEAMRNTYS